MSPTESAASSRKLWEPWPARSRAEVVVYPGQRPHVERTARRLFGRRLHPWEYAGLAGAPDDARVELDTFHGQLSLETSDPISGCYRLFHYVDSSRAGLVVVKEGAGILRRKMQRKGLGLSIFHRQVENTMALGVDCIETLAGRRDDENGYYTWPRFGFDGRLPAEVIENLPPGLEDAVTVLDLMDCEQGRVWWREHGTTIRVLFDLTEGSRSRMMFDGYVRSKLGGGQKEDLKIGAR